MTENEVIDMNWLLNLPAILRHEIVVDVRTVHPVLIKGVYAQTVQTKMDVVYFFIHALD